MEQVVFVVTECNPFHNGHRALFDEIRRRFPHRGIVCIQSGNFVQRGEFAVADKYLRAAETVRGGADLVLELIPPYCALSGEAFAACAVRVAAGLGFQGTLAFGSEVPDLEELQRILERTRTPLFRAMMKGMRERRRDMGYPAVRAQLYETMYGPCPALRGSNASLGLAYLDALKREDAGIEPLPLCRTEGGDITSAAKLRTLLRAGKQAEAARFMAPGEASRLFGDKAPLAAFPLSDVLLYILCTLPKEELASFYGMAPLADRAAFLARDAVTAEEVFSGLKAAHLTDSRIRRSLLAVLLRTPKGIEESSPPYTVLLAANEKGRVLLAACRKAQGGVKIVTKPADVIADPDLRAAAERAAFADSLYALAQGRPAARFVRQSPVML